MGSGFAKKKKEARLLHEKFNEMQEKMKTEEFHGQSGGGLVSITLNGNHEMMKIKIKPDCVDKDDIEGLEDLIKAAYNDASAKAEKSASSMEGMGMPGFGGFGM